MKQIETDPKSDQKKWVLSLAHQIAHKNRINGSLDTSDIVDLAVSTSKKTLFTGNRSGQVYSFVLPDTTDTFHFLREDRYKDCMSCRKLFSVLGKLKKDKVYRKLIYGSLYRKEKPLSYLWRLVQNFMKVCRFSKVVS